MATRPARLPDLKPMPINPKDSRYERGTTGGQVRAYASVPDAREGIGRYLSFYNAKRPHLSLDRQTPDQAYFSALQPIQVAA
jgi:putative transposase